MTGELLVRPAVSADRPDVVAIAREVTAAGDTYAFDPDVTDDELWEYFAPGARGDGFVAERDGRIVGVFVIRPNLPGPGAHVANASFAVAGHARGTGVGRRLGEAAIRIAAELGYRAMQFNTVVSTNAAAVRLWRSLGFDVVGTVPEGFRMPDGRHVDHFVMYRRLA